MSGTKHDPCPVWNQKSTLTYLRLLLNLHRLHNTFLFQPKPWCFPESNQVVLFEITITCLKLFRLFYNLATAIKAFLIFPSSLWVVLPRTSNTFFICSWPTSHHFFLPEAYMRLQPSELYKHGRYHQSYRFKYKIPFRHSSTAAQQGNCLWNHREGILTFGWTKKRKRNWQYLWACEIITLIFYRENYSRNQVNK